MTDTRSLCSRCADSLTCRFAGQNASRCIAFRSREIELWEPNVPVTLPRPDLPESDRHEVED